MSDVAETKTLSLSDFGRENGLYLQSIELQNWGPYSGQWIIPLKMLPALIIGENGTGKSSLMDGILTLLVQHNLKYNNAVDSKGKVSGVRTKAEYILGFKKSAADDSSHKKVEYLRDYGEISYILLRFSTFSRIYTIANLFMVSDGNIVAQRYVMKDGSLSSSDFPKDAPSFDAYCKELASLDSDIIVTSDRKAYFAFVSSKLHLEHNGQQLLASMSSQKDLKNVSDVIRAYMFLDKYDFRDEFISLQEALSGIIVVQQELQRYKKQDELLAQIAPLVDTVLDLKSQIALYESCRDKLFPYLYSRALGSLKKEIDKFERSESSFATQIEKLRKKRDALLSQSLSYQSKCDNLGGIELPKLQMQLEILSDKRSTLLAYRDKYFAILSNFGFDGLVSDDFSFSKSIDFLKSVSKKIKSQSSEILTKHFSVTKDLTFCIEKLAAVQKDYNYLQQHRVALPSILLDFRDELCSILNVPAANFPFLGEYLGVTEEEWQPALEYLFYNESASFLVPQKYQKQVAQIFDTLKAKYLKRPDRMTIGYRLMDTVNYTPSDGAWKKISIRQDMPYVSWVTEYVKRIGNVYCAENAKEFAEHSPSIMKNGLRRMDRIRHVLELKRDITDARYFLMSGSYQARLDALNSDIVTFSEEKKSLQNQLVILRKQYDEFQNKYDLLTSIPLPASYTMIDSSSLDIEISSIQKSIDVFLKNPDFQALQEKIAHCKEEIESVDEKIRTLDSQKSEATRQKGSVSSLLESYQTTLFTVSFTDEELTSLNAIYDKSSLSDSSSYTVILDAHKPFSARYTNMLKPLSIDYDSQSKHLLHLMEYYLDEFPHRKSELTATLEKPAEARRFIVEYENCHDSWLPGAMEKCQGAFDVVRETNFHTFIISLSHGVDDSVNRVIGMINKALHQIPYRNGADATFLHVDCRRTRRSDISDLRDLIDSVASAIVDREHPSEFLEKMNELNDYILRYIDVSKVPTKATTKYSSDNILDIRNWFEFPIAECRWSEDGNDFYHVKELDEIGKQSGGEGIKLNYFVMASCYSMWMHLYDTDYNSNVFCFLLVDEIDTKMSPGNLHDVIHLFHQMGIQLVSLLPLGDKVSQYEGFVGNIICTGHLNHYESYLETISYVDYVNRNTQLLLEKLKRGKEQYNNVKNRLS